MQKLNSRVFTFFNLEDGRHRIKREKPNRQLQAQHKYLEMALVADNFAISAYGEDEMTFHLLAIAHIVSFFFFFYSLYSFEEVKIMLR